MTYLNKKRILKKPIPWMCKNYSAHSVDSLEKRIADTEGKI